VEKLDSFLSGEYIGRMVIGGSDEAVSLIKGKLHKTVLDKVIATVRVEMFAKSDEVLKRVEPVLALYEKKKEEETVETLIARAMKNENAVLGLDNVLNALQEQRVMKLIFLKDYKSAGYGCKSCGFLTAQKITSCIYCKGEMEGIDYIIDMAGQKAVQQDALIEVIGENKKLLNAGGIGAFLRY
jgi:peptide chain release factor subunit 1